VGVEENIWTYVYVCVCVCEREREREGESNGRLEITAQRGVSSVCIIHQILVG
jgi:hypothetical protein